MKPFTRVLSAFAVGILLQGGVYLYLDQYMFAPTTDFNVAGASKDDTKNFPDVKEGTKYVSYDRQFMAVVTESSLKIYKANESKPTTIDIMGLYDSREVVMARLNADDPEHEVDTKLEDLPRNSKIVDAAYSEATNVVYMKVKVQEHAYRIYRTDANYDTRRVYMQATDIGHIGVFYDEDRFFYDNAKTGDIFMFNGIEGGWRVINPPGRFRLIGVDMDKTIYIARVDEDNNALTVYTGKLGVGFKPVYKYNHPITFNELTLSDVKTIIKDGSDETTKVTEDDTSSKSSSDSKKKS
ncbi:MAG: hypothetical protein E7C91_07015 [Veillonella sp.]|nr:hypothetical protein [Veillonella sp.]